MLAERNEKLRIQTPRLQLAALDVSHDASLLKLMQNNQAHFSPWSPSPPKDFYTLPFWQRHAEKYTAESVAGTAMRWVMKSLANDALIGTINLTQIARGPFHSAMLGYQIDNAHESQGLMHEALAAVVQDAFHRLKLHRLQASYVTHNVRSAQLLARLSFETVGTARKYLYINGAWRDHVMTQRCHDSFDNTVFTQ